MKIRTFENSKLLHYRAFNLQNIKTRVYSRVFTRELKIAHYRAESYGTLGIGH